MANFSNITQAGNLVRDPEMKTVGENAVVNFTLATNRKFKKNGEIVEKTTFVDVEAWGKTADICAQYLTKGKSCLVNGRLDMDSWEKDGQKRSKLKIVAEQVQFLDRLDSVARNDAPSAPRVPAQSPVDSSDGVPF